MSLSQTAKEVESLKQVMAEVNQRLAELSSENDRLRRSESDAWEMANDSAGKQSKAETERDEANKKATWLAETIVSRDSRVAELETELAKVKAELTSSLDTVHSLDHECGQLKDEVATHKGQTDYWKDRAQTAEAERDSHKAKVEQIKSLFGGEPKADPGFRPDTEHPAENQEFPRAVSSW